MFAKIIIAAVITATSVCTMPFDVSAPKEYIGEFEITAYSYSEGYGENYQTASGETPEPYYTVAVDPAVIPLGTTLYIEGVGEVKAQDTGGAVKGNVIDLHVGGDNPKEWGRQIKKVYRSE